MGEARALNGQDCLSPAHALGRRSALKALALGLLLAAASCTTLTGKLLVRAPARKPPLEPGTAPPTSPPVREIYAPTDPNSIEVIWSAKSNEPMVALTLDDGYCAPCIEGYLSFALETGTHLTFNPNGIYAALWTPAMVDAARQLVAAGQLEFGNHTFSHKDLTTLKDRRVIAELTINEEWIADTFLTTTRPFYRPPFGRFDRRVQQLAAEAGFVKTLMWNGTLGDATLETPAQIVALALKWIRPGAIVIGHLNHPPVLSVLPEILSIISQRGLQAVTVSELLRMARELT